MTLDVSNVTNWQPPSHAEIARRAYHIWSKRGRPGGCELENWLQAEEEIKLEKQLAIRAARHSVKEVRLGHVRAAV